MGTYNGPPNDRPPGTYRITWTETSDHEVDLTPEALADLLGITVEQLREDEADEFGIDPDGNLSDLLADVDGFQGLTRDGIDIEPPEGNTLPFPQTPEDAITCPHGNQVWFGHECGLC